MMVRATKIVACLALLASPSVLAQEVAVPASAFALTNARIVVAPGNVIERGAVLIRDGRIVEVRSRVTAPADAVEIDLSGMTVYPGLVEVASSVGLPEARRGGGRGGGGGRPPPRGPDDPPPPEIQPARLASDAFSPGDSVMETLRRAGITTVGLAFEGGLFPGQTAALSTGAGAARSQVLRTPVALQIALNGTRGGYPSTLMGALAYVEQSFEDTRYDMRVREAFQRDPRSAPRPSFDPEHQALELAATGRMQVWMAASRERDFPRVASLAERLGVQDFVFLGGQEGYRATEFLARAGRPVIVSLDYPDPDQVTGRALEYNIAPISGDDVVDEEADSTVARDLRSNAAALVGAGVTIALSSFGAEVEESRARGRRRGRAGRGADDETTPARLLDLVRGVVEAGLDADEALRAITTTPARLLGLEAVIGTVEEGKLANLIVTDGDIFGEDTHVVQVFVEGVRFVYPPDDSDEDEMPRRGRGRRGGTR